MDEGWGNLIYLIVIAFFAIVSALKKKKQAVAVPLPNDEEEDDGVMQQPISEPSTGLESILESFLGNEVPKPYVQPVEEVLPKPAETMMEEYARLQKEKEDSSENYEKSALSNLKSIYSDQDELVEDQEEEVDWRQAIIYKEILDRKYN